ncbi:MAG TPA: histidine--tRNA ligase [Bacillota bacterium]|nr:histidine--tRNA ligase [Bacillota bacterium]
MGKNITKPSILPGFMELLPAEQIVFNRMLDTIRRNYEKFGFVPFDTPAIEKSEILLAKGGGETEKQIYRFTKGDTDLSLRFDLTVPLARYVAQHFSDLTFPFRRYHIAKVYRGERNQRGRFREFYQCDIDIIGNGKLSIINDAEIPSVIYSTFKELGLGDFTIRMNNRKILNGLFKALEIDNPVDVLRTIDKLEKIGQEAVIGELESLGLKQDSIDRIIEFIGIKGENSAVVAALKSLKVENEEFRLGVEELAKVLHYAKGFAIPEQNLKIDLTVARGLDYYTGTIYETMLNDYPGIGSVCSGGRYENLAEYYTNQKLPGVGISIGLTRLFYQLREANVIAVNPASTLSQVLVIPLDEQSTDYAIQVANALRDAGSVTEVYFEETKTDKKLGYANKLGIPYVVLLGSDEVATGQLTLKDMQTGTQEKMELAQIIRRVSRK